MNDFYKQPLLFQWLEAILLLLIGFCPALFIFDQAPSKPILYLLLLVFLPLFQFAASPLFKLAGIYRYYSPMLFGYKANSKQIDLHSGSSFDYLFVMRKYNAGTEFKNRLLQFHLEGLLTIINLIENNVISPTTNIVATSYFFNDRTLQKLGFEIERPSLFQRINLFANFIDLLWMYSVAQGRFTIPNLLTAKKACIAANKLTESKKLIESLHEKMTLKSKKRA